VDLDPGRALPLCSGELLLELLEGGLFVGQPGVLLGELAVLDAGGLDGVAACPPGQAPPMACQP